MAIFHPVANNFLLCIIHVFGNRYYYQLLQAREADMSHWVEGAPLSLDCEDMPVIPSDATSQSSDNKTSMVVPYLTVIQSRCFSLPHVIPHRMIKSRWLVGTDDLFTVKTIHSSRVSKFWFFFEILDLMTI